ncbi:hypothetical protein EON66_12135 [archaeon]|nr:MAG: hypothetical protein EON66_12135 [archaeon]
MQYFKKDDDVDVSNVPPGVCALCGGNLHADAGSHAPLSTTAAHGAPKLLDAQFVDVEAAEDSSEEASSDEDTAAVLWAFMPQSMRPKPAARPAHVVRARRRTEKVKVAVASSGEVFKLPCEHWYVAHAR